MKNLSPKAILFCMVVLSFFNLSAQLEFTSRKRILFVGVETIKNKKIIVSAHVEPIDSFNLKLELEVLEDWKNKDSLSERLVLDRTSIPEDKYFIQINGKTFPAYRYTNEQGYELLLAKERHFDYYDNNHREHKHSWSLSYAKLEIPENRKFYIRKPPLLFEK